MKKWIVTILMLFAANFAFADSVLIEGFEYANHNGETPVGWDVANNSWVCGYMAQDHNRMPHSGNWYAHTNSAESWMFMPIYLNAELKYRFSLWAISDGGYQLELWAGNEANSNAMTQLLLDDIVSSGSYEKFSVYVENIASNYQYFGIHAVQSYCGDCLLTIDDIIVDQIVQYDFSASPHETDTVLQPGANIAFTCKITSDGFEPITIYITPSTEYFTDIHFYVDGEETDRFPIVQDETVPIRGIATLRPDVEPGTRCWFDVLFTIDCGCATAMYTYWATVVSDGVDESFEEISWYPNPSTGNVTFEGAGQITIYNTTGQMVFTKEIIEKESITLKSGIYFIKMDDQSVTKLVVK